MHCRVGGALKCPSVRKKHVTNKGLLGVQRVSECQGCCFRLTSEHFLDVPSGGHSTATASSAVCTASAVDGSDIAVGIDPNVGSIDDEARPSIRDVMRHGSKTSDSSERKAREASHAEAATVGATEILFQSSVDFITTERRGDKGVIGTKAKVLEGCVDFFAEFSVGQGAWEVLLDAIVRRLL